MGGLDRLGRGHDGMVWRGQVLLLLCVQWRHVGVGHAGRYGLLAGVLHEKLRFVQVLLLLTGLGQA